MLMAAEQNGAEPVGYSCEAPLNGGRALNSRRHKLSTRTFTDELKTEIVRRLQSGVQAETLAYHLGVVPALLEGWREDYESASRKTARSSQRHKVERGDAAAESDSLRLETLERVIGRQALEIDFLKRTLLRLKELPAGYGQNWRKRVYAAIQAEEELARPLILSPDRAEIGWPSD